MSDPVADNPIIQRMEALLAEMRAERERSEGVLKELHSALKASHAVVQSTQEATDNLEAHVRRTIDTNFTKAMEEGCKRYEEELGDAIELCKQRIFQGFDRLVNQLMTGNAEGRTMGSRASSMFMIPGADKHLKQMHDPVIIRQISERLMKRELERRNPKKAVAATKRTSGQQATSPSGPKRKKKRR